MKRVALAVVLLALGSAAGAALAPCLSGVEAFVLHPSGAVTLDGLILQRSATSGRFEDDAGVGLSFDVNNSDAGAVELLDATTCTTVAKQVVLEVVDPFDPDAGVQRVVLEAP